MRVSERRGCLITALALTSVVHCEDVLHSQRLTKRGIDADGNYNISFFHVNDVHSHLDEFSSSGTDCTRPERGCYGGYARIKHVIDTERPRYNDSLWLNVGDEFQVGYFVKLITTPNTRNDGVQGTLFYTYYGGEKIAETINQLGFDAMTLGNHEFDGGDEELGQFLENLTFPIVSANIHSENEKLNKTIKPFHIFEEYQLAIIGVTTETTPSISSPGETTTFSNAVEAVQQTVNHIRSTTNINRIAAITHIGYDEDQALAQNTTGLYLIMGGHSHTLLGDMEDAEGKYPTIVKNKDGEEVFIVTAYRWGEYVGCIDVTYDAEGKILAYRGAPIHITNTTAQDEDLQKQIEGWRGPFEEFAAEVLGKAEVTLDQTTCQKRECLLGDFMCDAMLAYRRNTSDTADFALINAGGIRATIDEGDITRGEVLTSFPFGNAIVEITMTGEKLWKVLEGIVTGVNVENGKAVTSFFQVSTGIKVQYNPQNNNGSKLVNVTIGNGPLDNATEYNIVTLDFLAGGGDNIFPVTTDFVTLDTQDQVLAQYVQAQTPIKIKLEGRIEAVNGTAGSPSPSPSASGSPTASGTGAQASSTGAANGKSSGKEVLGACVLAVLASVFFI
ncbi:Metallo-dependent phosphatase-like protein [Clohesyomyces aquaticus]|uniref:Metallo-dependent phosphatase-like protein n=1 Tax=Clohesyomyces aquaticus TaxID=1231657 RepID=A0A1Y1ZL20_9PLEO|nr:Metallo-dependent phosphatase-like protein [Clohesyomyces aquaticus]